MRTFYFFEIKPELMTLLKANPYELFKTLETIFLIFTNEPKDLSLLFPYEIGLNKY